ncbi:hypothetical protein [Brevundimonas sp.]|uniref:hypothetical protein n=1 Tax=Brevundimonas sp. TaxID=1871086 RepID=UPI003D10AA06
MLSMLLLLAASPQSAIPPMPPAPIPGEQGTMRVLGQPEPGCASLAMPANDPNAGNSLLWREGQDTVGHYLLLDRRVNGCPAPIVVNYRVPGSNAVGREAGRAPAPSSVIIRP